VVGDPFDAGDGRYYYLFYTGNQVAQGTYLTERSFKGVISSDPATVIPAGSMPAFVHNVGVSGTATGNLDRHFVLVAYGAHYDLDPITTTTAKFPASHIAGAIGTSTDSC
jgi:hypothetical protein